MSWFVVETVNYYEALGLNRSATMDDIKKAYRRLVRHNHPDVSVADTEEEKQAKTARFDEATKAYEWLQENHKPEVPFNTIREPEASTDTTERIVDVSIDGVYATLHYMRSEWGSPKLNMHIDLDEARKLKSFLEDERLTKVYVFDGGQLAFEVSGYTFSYFEAQLRAYEKRKQAKGFSEQLAGFRKTANQYHNEGRPVTKLWELLYNLERVLGNFEHSWYRGKSIADVKSALKAVENELNRVASGGVSLLVDGLIDGSVFHPDVQHNNEVIMQLNALSIRSAGFIEPITEEALRNLYEDRLGNATSLNDILYTSLRLNLDDYAPQDILDELDLAPETVTIQNGNRSVNYSVTYNMIVVGDVATEVGVITIPLSLYKKIGYVYGKPSQLPVLPYGIKLMLVVDQQGRQVASGFDNEVLAQKVNKFTKSAARGQKLQGTAARDGYGLNGVFDVTPPPPWFKRSR